MTDPGASQMWGRGGVVYEGKPGGLPMGEGNASSDEDCPVGIEEATQMTVE
jgi:hypothetical protein